jgi:hypothetical protein
LKASMPRFVCPCVRPLCCTDASQERALRSAGAPPPLSPPSLQLPPFIPPCVPGSPARAGPEPALPCAGAGLNRAIHGRDAAR